MWQSDLAALTVVHRRDERLGNEVCAAASAETKSGHRRLHVLLNEAFALHNEWDVVLLGSHEIPDSSTDATNHKQAVCALIRDGLEGSHQSRLITKLGLDWLLALRGHHKAVLISE
jgi:hypothetical protein